jgi:hypothetical protein
MVKVEEKLRVLLTEYSALRSEIVARIGHGYQLLAIGTAAMAFFAVIYKGAPWQLLTFIGALMIVVYVFGCWFILRDIYKLAGRVREIEYDVNDRCEEDLLLWETLSGGAKTGFWLGYMPFPRHEMKTLPKPRRTFRGDDLNSESPSSNDSSPAPAAAARGEVDAHIA